MGGWMDGWMNTHGWNEYTGIQGCDSDSRLKLSQKKRKSLPKEEDWPSGPSVACHPPRVGERNS